MKTQAGIIAAVLAVVTCACMGSPARAAEPTIGEYTNYPIFQVNAVEPNILVILDNSGSMNMNAYGTYPGDYGTVAEGFNGGPPFCNVKESRVSQNADNIEAYVSPSQTYYSTTDSGFDIGTFNDGGSGTESVVGLRFPNVAVPPGRTITRAYIQFTAYNTQSVATSVKIYAQDSDDPSTFSTKTDVLGRACSSASVDWTIPAWTSGQSDNDTRSPDLTALVQSLVDREGWQSGNAMAFLLKDGSGYRECRSYAYSSSSAPVLHIVFEEEEGDCTRYYGYFDPDARYTYDGSKFIRDASGDWDGNWLNWCCMRRIDVLRKVLMGGLATARTGGGNQVNYCENPDQSNRNFYRWFNGTGTDYTPYSGNYRYYVYLNYLRVDTDGDGSFTDSGGSASFNLRIQRDATAEPQDFLDGNLAGVLQRIGDKARWGNEWFYYGSGTNQEGGYVENRIGTNMTTLITTLQNTGADTWTPLAEAYYVAMQHFKQEPADTSLGFKAGASLALNAGTDPYYNGTEYVECAKSFVILLTDGASTQDRNVPSSLRNYDGDTSETTRYFADSGSDYLDDIALYARTNDLRADLDGDQSMILYTIYAFGDEANARALLQDAARNGGFIDKNGNDRPDLQSEWDADGDNVPDTYFEAQDGYQLEKELLAAINDILKRAASGTAVSVLATKGEGEGTLVQAFFRPTVTSGIQDIKWVGYLQSLWVDTYGNTREDTNGNYTLDVDADTIIKFDLDEGTGETVVRRYAVSASNPYPDTSDNATETVPLESLVPIWEAGDILADTPASLRRIYTYVGDGTEVTPHDNFVAFTESNRDRFSAALGIMDDATWGYLGATADERACNLVRFVRGEDDGAGTYTGTVEIRTRTMDDGRLWKLSDIVYSTPVSVSKPVESYDLLYNDASYRDYYLQYKDRETMVYVGSNGGMLHAFTSGVYRRFEQKFYSIHDGAAGYDLSAIPDTLGIGNVPPGSELWAYIPQSLLPHLKWLPKEDYTHVNYVDLRPRIFDAKIFTADNATHPGGWGTVLVGGLNMGGREITANPDNATSQTFHPCYFAIDVTNPRDPRLLWEADFPELGMTTNMPTILRVGGEWFLALGSGPTTYEGTSSHSGHVFLVDLKTGGRVYYRDFEVPGGDAFMNSPSALDKVMNYNVDAVYAGATYGDDTGRLVRISVPQTGGTFDPLAEDDDYVVDPAQWSMTTMFLSPAPLTAPVTMSVDRLNNAWVYFGSGRYIDEADKSTSQQQYIFGLKDPFFNADQTDCYGTYPAVECIINPGGDLDDDDLFDADPYSVFRGGTVTGGDSSLDTFAKLLDEVRQDTCSGWYRELESTSPSERVLNKPSILGGILLVPTYTPNDDICGFGGEGRLFTLFYETGTAYFKRVVGPQDQTQILDVIDLGPGISSSFGVHVGKEEGSTVYGQMSTGVIEQIDIMPAFNPKSKPIYWKEEP